MTYLRLRQEGSSSVVSLVLIDSAAYPQELPFFVSLLRNPLLRALVNITPAKTRASYTLKRLFFDPSAITPERIERYARFFDLPGAHSALAQCARQIIPDDADAFVKTLSTIQIPTLLMWGQDDRVIPLSAANRLHADLVKSELKIIPQCGHIPHEERPAVTAEVITTFVTKLAVP